MELVRTLSEIERNIAYLESDEVHSGREHKDYVKKGTCFLAYDGRAGTSFAPSRLIGYVDNNFEKHAANEKKDGRDTNPAISEILGSNPGADAELEQAYQEYCRTLGFEPNERGSFGVERKFWDLRKST